MPDWQELVRRRLSGLALDSGEKEDVQKELAAHLEDSYEDLVRKGFADSEATKRTFAQVADWRKLERSIQIAQQKENTMTPRTGRFLLPSFVTLLLAMTMIPMLEQLGLNVHFFFFPRPHGQEYAFSVYPVWLMLLPFVAALGAYLSSRAGGTRPAIIVSGTFPALAFFVVLLLVLPYMGFLEHGLEANARSVFDNIIKEPFGPLGVVAGWVLVPGACLLIGVQAYLLISRRLAQRGATTH